MRNARWPRTASSCDDDVLERSRDIRGEDHVHDVLADRARVRGRWSRRSRPGPRAAPPRRRGRARSPPTSSRCSARTRLSPDLHTASRAAATPRLSRFSCRRSRMRPRQRRIAETRILGSINALARRGSESSGAALARGELVDLDQPDGTRRARSTSCAMRMPGSTANASRRSVLTGRHGSRRGSRSR